MDLGPRGALEPVALDLAEVELRDRLVVEVRELARGAAGRREDEELVGPAGGVVEEREPSPPLTERPVELPVAWTGVSPVPSAFILKTGTTPLSSAVSHSVWPSAENWTSSIE